MVQDTGDPVVPTGAIGTTSFFNLSNAVAALRSMLSGTTAPNNPAFPQGALWLDTDTASNHQPAVRQKGASVVHPLWPSEAWPLSLVPENTGTAGDRDADFSVDEDDGASFYRVAPTAARAVTLDSSLVQPYQIYWIGNVNGSFNVTVAPTGGEEWVEGGASPKTLATAGSNAAYFWDGAKWWTL